MRTKTYLPLEEHFTIAPCFDAWDVRRYWEWEEKVARPVMEAAGWEVGQFYSTEQDSFGPLGRAVTALKDGHEVRFYYG